MHVNIARWYVTFTRRSRCHQSVRARCAAAYRVMVAERRIINDIDEGVDLDT